MLYQQQQEMRKIISSSSIPFYEIASQERIESISKRLPECRHNPLSGSFLKKEKEPKKSQSSLKKTHSYSKILEKKILPSLTKELTHSKATPVINNASTSIGITTTNNINSNNISEERRGRKRRLSSSSSKCFDEDEDLDILLEESKNISIFTAEENAYCKKIVRMLMNHEYGWPFIQPVDPVALNIPDYFDIIKHPMDLSTIMTKLQKNHYSSMTDFVKDVELVFSNARTYNPPGTDVHLMANTLSNYFNLHFHPKKKKSTN